MIDTADAIDAPCDNGFAVDVARCVEADRALKATKVVYASAVEERRAAILVLKNVHHMDNKRIGNLLGLTPGAIYRVLTPRRSREATTEPA